MSLIIAAVISVCIMGFLYSGVKHINNMLSNTLIYKDTPCLVRMHQQLNADYEKAKKQSCYGEMGRVAEKMAQIVKELEQRTENTRLKDLI